MSQVENINGIIDDAMLAARKAAFSYYNHELNSIDQPMCGFAWVVVRGVRSNSKVGKALLANGFRRSSYEGGLVLWNPANLPVQNMDVKMSGAKAYAKVLKLAGLEAEAASRLD